MRSHRVRLFRSHTRCRRRRRTLPCRRPRRRHRHIATQSSKPGGIPMRSARFRRGSRGGARPGASAPEIPKIGVVEVDPNFRPRGDVFASQITSRAVAPADPATSGQERTERGGRGGGRRRSRPKPGQGDLGGNTSPRGRKLGSTSTTPIFGSPARWRRDGRHARAAAEAGAAHRNATGFDDCVLYGGGGAEDVGMGVSSSSSTSSVGAEKTGRGGSASSLTASLLPVGRLLVDADPADCLLDQPECVSKRESRLRRRRRWCVRLFGRWPARRARWPFLHGRGPPRPRPRPPRRLRGFSVASLIAASAGCAARPLDLWAEGDLVLAIVESGQRNQATAGSLDHELAEARKPPRPSRRSSGSISCMTCFKRSERMTSLCAVICFDRFPRPAPTDPALRTRHRSSS